MEAIFSSGISFTQINSCVASETHGLRFVVQSGGLKWDDPNEYERRFRWVRSRNNASFDLHTALTTRVSTFPP